MERQQTYPGWFLWLAERRPFSWLSLILLVFLVVIGVACYYDSAKSARNRNTLGSQQR